MLADLGFDSLDALMDAAVPGGIRAADELGLPAAATEQQAARELREVAARNTPREPMIGLGYHGTITPPVVRRNVLEDPSWYTAYTPYQPEISQGRLEALINFQTMVGDLTGLPTANASLLDEATAVAEAMTLVRRGNKKATGPFVVDANALPQTIAVVQTRAHAMGIPVVVADLDGRAPRGRRVRRAGAVPRGRRSRPRPPPGRRGGARARRDGRRRGRPARPDPARVARRDGRRRGRRLVPALRRAAVLRRPARRLHVRAPRPRAAPARSPGRRLGGRGGPPGVPAGAADPRAAHPSRQGHLQHLHGAGAARRGGVDVRRLPRSRGAAGDRAAHPPLRRGAGRRAARGRRRRAPREVLRHRHRARARGSGRRRGRRPRARRAPAARRRRHGRHLDVRDHLARARRGGPGGLRGHRRRRRTSTPAPATSCPPRCCARRSS